MTKGYLLHGERRPLGIGVKVWCLFVMERGVSLCVVSQHDWQSLTAQRRICHNVKP